MANPEYGEPLFGFLKDFEAQRDENLQLRQRVDQLNQRLDWAHKNASKLREEIRKNEEERKSERERLCEWLDRRIAQQEEAMSLGFVSTETKRVMEIEIAILRRYREIIVGSSHTKGQDDPFMPRPG